MGIEKTKAFHAFSRSQLLDLIRKWGLKGDIVVIELHLNKTTLQIKSGNNIGEKFQSDAGVGLSTIFSTILLDVALRKAEEKLERWERDWNDDQNYSKPSNEIQPHGCAYANRGNTIFTNNAPVTAFLRSAATSVFHFKAAVIRPVSMFETLTTF